EPEAEDEPLILWYADEALTEYLNSMALAYYEEYGGTKVTPVLVSGVEYMEQINKASVDDEAAPDLYITSNDNLMKAYLAGLAVLITEEEETVIPKYYPLTALHAVTCRDAYVAYPFYYETNFFLYNKTFMADIAKQAIEEEADLAAAEEALNELAEEGEPEPTTEIATDENADGISANTVSDASVDEAAGESGVDEEAYELSPEVLQQMSTMIPSTIDDILAFADNYDAPETVEYVFRWDVSDIFYNYFFIGNYIDVGGESGDNNANFTVYNQGTIDCLQVYQDLNQFFSIDTKEVTYESILEDFIQGKTVFTVATTDAIGKIEEAKAAGEFNYDYGVGVLPDVSSKLKARGLSVTNAVAINGYSRRQKEANAFARYLTYENLDTLYNRAGKMACRYNVPYENDEINNVMLEYQKSVSLPKMIEASNFWVQLEITFTKVWTGSDPEEELLALSELLGSQIDEIGYHIPVQESISAGADDDIK
ncbi:MAG TPA: extracellular solute-binding protein, partial [Lachnospiraceae bacterium]|nr:extracellular solute-binding protein [Lachnospiraceae bacterium]